MSQLQDEGSDGIRFRFSAVRFLFLASVFLLVGGHFLEVKQMVSLASWERGQFISDEKLQHNCILFHCVQA